MSLLGKTYYRCCGSIPGHRAAQAAVGAIRALGALRSFRMPIEALTLPHCATAELMQLWQRMHWSSGDGMMPPRELFTIYSLATRCRTRGDFVELGSWKGLTTCYLATACRVRGCGHVYAVDTFAGTREGGTQYAGTASCGGSTLAQFESTIRRAGLESLVTACVGYTTDVVAQHRDRTIAFLLIDADHSYEGVRADFEAWFPLVAEGGTIVFHDYAMVDAGVGAYVDAEIVGRDDLAVIDCTAVPNVYAAVKLASSTAGPERIVAPAHAVATVQ